MSDSSSDTAPPKRELSQLRHIVRFVRPYGWVMAGAGVALTVAAATVLGMGVGLRRLVDGGFAAGNAALLDQSLFALLGVILLLAAATYSRFFLVTWLGERVVADIRRAVFSHVLELSPGFFETTRTGEVLSRITTDTTLLQAVIGSSVSMALRNTLLLIGGLGMLAVTSPKLTGMVIIAVPIVIAPIVLIGRRVVLPGGEPVGVGNGILIQFMQVPMVVPLAILLSFFIVPPA